MSRYDHKIETSLEGIEHLSKEKKEEKETDVGRSPIHWIQNHFPKLIIDEQGKVNRWLANHSLSSTASQGIES